MKREFLKELGLSDEQIDKIMAEHGRTVNSMKDELEKAKELEQQIQSLQEQLQQRDQQLEELKTKATGNEELQKQIQQLQEQNKQIQQEYEQKMQKQAFDFALERALASAKARNPKAVKALLDTEAIKLDGDKLLGLEEQLKRLKESDPYMFEEEQEQETPKPTFSTGQYQKGDQKMDDPFLAKLAKYKK